MNDLSGIAHIVELAVAPVFLLAGIGALLNVVTARLARVIDRARALEDRFFTQPDDVEMARLRSELGFLDKRMAYAQRAVLLFSVAALLVCVVVATLFVGAFISLNVATAVALMFIAAMVAMIGGLSSFLLEITIATRTMRVRADLFAR